MRRPKPRFVRRIVDGKPYGYEVYFGDEHRGAVHRGKFPLPWGGYAWRWYATSSCIEYTCYSPSCVAQVGHERTRLGAARLLAPVTSPGGRVPRDCSHL